MLTNEYLKRVYEGLEKRNANEPEFLQAVREVLESIQPVVEKHPEYEKAALIERLVEPERIITFRVPWVDDQVIPFRLSGTHQHLEDICFEMLMRA